MSMTLRFKIFKRCAHLVINGEVLYYGVVSVMLVHGEWDDWYSVCCISRKSTSSTL